MLAGSEVKSLRESKASLQDAYARVSDGEVWIHGLHIAPYAFSRDELDPIRPRKLLLHRRQILELERPTMEKGMTLVPLPLSFTHPPPKRQLPLAPANP